MTIELTKEAKQTALESLQKYFEVNMDEPLGNLKAGPLWLHRASRALVR